MTSNPRSLPTLPKLGVSSLPQELDALKIAAQWFDTFSTRLVAGDTEGILDLIVDDAFFRDILVLTWDFRTIEGRQAIRVFLQDRVSAIKFDTGSFVLKDATLQQPYPDLAWIQAFFTFSTDISEASGVFRLVPIPSANSIAWKAHTIFTNLENLKNFPEKIGSLRDHLPNHGKWADKRAREIAFADEDPAVLVIGGGQSGLDIAARLKALDVPTLVVEKYARIGDQWRNRYEALCLHDPVWYDHLPYIPFPPTWPVYTPALKLADWLEFYAHSLELNIWTSSTVTHASQDELTKKWTVVVKRADGQERKFTVNHLVLATGFGGGVPRIPKYPGAGNFEGKIIHSTQYRRATDHAGKKVVVVGACTSGHDIAADHYEHGIDVTMYQRGPTYVMSTNKGGSILSGALYSETAPPTDVADRISASFPYNLLKLMHQRVTRDIAEADKDILDGLRKRGFKLSLGIDDSGPLILTLERAGGYYLDVGTSQLIADGKIKLKNDSNIARFTKTGLAFENGSEIPADVVIFSTGYGEPRDPLRLICGDAVADRCPPIWGLDKEGEVNGAWRDVGIPHLWFILGNLAMCRFHSKHVALQIKAIEEGVLKSKYKKSA